MQLFWPYLQGKVKSNNLHRSQRCRELVHRFPGTVKTSGVRQTFSTDECELYHSEVIWYSDFKHKVPSGQLLNTSITLLPVPFVRVCELLWVHFASWTSWLAVRKICINLPLEAPPLSYHFISALNGGAWKSWDGTGVSHKWGASTLLRTTRIY
jgi:hypothetical protein